MATCKFITNVDEAPKSSIGYGFGVFTLEALTVVEKNIQDSFSENGNHPLVKLVANEKLKSAFKKNKRLVSSYTESVLVKEACSVIMQESPGPYRFANAGRPARTGITLFPGAAPVEAGQ
ncbi:hypothetical protein DPMN_170107 [Dreissena polymorpha]|uniref:Uncharacterized protein n=1 Tax=Dreissena polymorpha TaxID=45954 RepID=A0A9D4ICL6_DREPO|nr:hypothetical protein DPMN_170107 [Dreissena polymorpha]